MLREQRLTRARNRVLVAAALGAMLAAGLMRPLWNAEWAIMDDHGQLASIGSSGSVSLADVPDLLRSTEAAHPGSSSRYRPGTMIYQAVEVAIIKAHPGRWFVWRTVQFAFVLAVIWWVAAAFVGGGLATFLTIYATTQYYWRDIWVHLFVAENWCAVWLACFAVALVRLWNARDALETRGTGPLAWMAVMALFAGATKENFLVLVPLQLGALWWAVRRARIGRAAMIASGVMVAGAAFIAVAVMIGLRRNGFSDVYGNDVSANGRLGLFVQPFSLWVGGVALAFVVVRRAALAYGTGRLAAAQMAAWRLLWCELLCLTAGAVLVLESQFVFYNGKWPGGGGRFDFPGRLVELVAYGALICLVSRAGAVWQWSSSPRRVASLVLAAWLVFLTARKGAPLLDVARTQAEFTHELTAFRQNVAAIARARPDAPVVLSEISSDVNEPAMAIARELRVVEQVGNPIFLRLTGSGSTPNDSTDTARLPPRSELRLLSDSGGGGWPRRLAPPISPWRGYLRLRATGVTPVACIEIRSYDLPALHDCNSSGR